ncbi:hypothetical protein HO173_008590 [Letharia columbiana]|uniref:Uncharacterized protein n=1 Tax=Letharia columbiana TaxID=112416 RepID=A0A8H6FRD2_9LECA|nr:uncharacterized protein HO173_008590 [Letharia columbiana]KAF6233298.1 hypothetical protein HO173_008590 [Letharia columbiana]
MVIPAPDPLSAISSSFNATIKILEVTYQLKAVDEQTADLLGTTRHVDFMVQEAHRLRRLKAGLLNTSERTMIDRVINDTEDALRAVAKLVEPCRVDKQTKHGIRFGHRIMWVFRDNPSVRDKHQKLQVCHQSLTVAFTCLYSKDVVVIAPAPEGTSEEQPPPYDPQLKELLDWPNRRKGRKIPGEREGHTTKDISLMDAGSNEISVGGPLSPCLLAIPLEDDGEVPKFSSHFSEMSFESPTIPTPEVQPFVRRNNSSPPTLATTSPKSNSQSPHISAHKFYSNDEIQSSTLTTNTNPRNGYISPTQSLPEIDSPPLATMIASYGPNSNEENDLRVSHEHVTHVSLACDKKPSSSANAPDTTPLNASSSPTIPIPALEKPSSSSSSTGYEPGLRWLESSRYNSYGPPEPTEGSSLGHHPLPARFNSDVQLRTTYQSDRFDALARAEDVLTREDRAVSVGQGTVKRGGRSWLAYHATRSDMGHGMDWDG